MKLREVRTIIKIKVPDGATHWDQDTDAPWFCKCVDGQWYYWRIDKQWCLCPRPATWVVPLDFADEV